jgi:hypothetical protein
VIAELRKRRPQLPITLGLYAPQATIKHEGGRWLLCPLVMDRDAAAVAGRAALAAGESWMPEMEWRFLREGEPTLACADKDDFIRELERMAWPYGGA